MTIQRVFGESYIDKTSLPGRLTYRQIALRPFHTYQLRGYVTVESKR